MRRLLGIGAVALLALSAATYVWFGTARTHRPAPFVLISIDTLRADHVGAYGYAPDTTPHIDRLAAGGIVFEQARAHASSTLSSHASILTSLLPNHHGASAGKATSIATGVVTLTEVLNVAGYATASFNGGVQLDPIYALDRGFDVYRSATPETRDSSILAGPEHTTDARVDESIAWLDGLTRDAPFFLFLHTYEIHHPYTPPAELLALFDAGYDGALPDSISVELLKSINRGQVEIDDGDLAHIVATYDAELRSADAALGRLFDELEARGLYDRALIIITSDHGEEFGEHDRIGWHAHSLHDKLLHVPLIVKLPQSAHAGRRVAHDVRLIDIAPSVLEWLGLEPSTTFDGDSLRPLLSAETAPSRPTLSIQDSHTEHMHWSLRAGAWKLDQHFRAVLYDLTDDPGEQVDVTKDNLPTVVRLQRQGRQMLEARPDPESVDLEVSDELEDGLRALGYIE